jgi:hypothetical protein
MKTEYPDDIICVIEVGATYKYEREQRTENLSENARRSFGRNAPDEKPRTSEISGSNGWNETWRLDDTTLAPVAERVAALVREARKYLDDIEQSPDHKTLVSKSETEVWLGTRDKFEPRPSDPNKLWALRDPPFRPMRLTGEISKETLADALTHFDLSASRARADEALQERLNNIAEGATVLAKPISQKPLHFKK